MDGPSCKALNTHRMGPSAYSWLASRCRYILEAVQPKAALLNTIRGLTV